MTSEKKIFSKILATAIVSFGFFGSLGHFFAVLLVFSKLYIYKKNKILYTHNYKNSLTLYLLLTGVFYILLTRGMVTQDFFVTLDSVAPMLPLPIVGILILLNKKGFSYTNIVKLSKYSQISIVFLFSLYVVLSLLPTEILPEKISITQKVSLLSGNSIPFSTVVFGLTVLSITGVHQKSNFNMLVSFFIFIIGIYASILLAGTRGTLVTLIVLSPFILWYVFKKRSAFVIATTSCFIFFIGTLLIHIYSPVKIEIVQNIINVYKTLYLTNIYDYSTYTRFQMWTAGLEAISNTPAFGFGISERFLALQPYFPDNFNYTFTHPHNDLIAGFIGGGAVGGIFTAICLCSPFWAWLIAKHKTVDGLFLGITLSVSIIVTANLNTVLFNDITCAWLSLSTFIVWAVCSNDTPQES